MYKIHYAISKSEPESKDAIKNELGYKIFPDFRLD